MDKKLIKFAAYGTCKRGEVNAHYCDHAASVKECTLVGTIYDTHLGYPVFVPNGNSIVSAELYEITEAELAEIDRLEGHPNYFRRIVLPVTLKDGTRDEAWVYILTEPPELSEA